MRRQSFAISADMVTEVLQAVVVIAVLTAVMELVGRPVLGEAVIAMLYLLAVGWLTSRTGRLPGLSAALSAARMFDFFFIPPYLTFTIGSVEGWLVFVIFVVVAVILIDRIQTGLAQAQAREREALLLYELSMALVGRRSRAELAATVAERLQQLYQAAQVEITLLPEGDAPGGQPAVNVSAPAQAARTTKPDQVVPLLTAQRLIGEIRVWHGEGVVMANAERLLASLAPQMTLALERMALAPNGPAR
jgi:two-component system sensor histidine kinase KdpD